MLTPAFELSQNSDFLIVSIQVPYAKISEIEVHFEDCDFMFYSKPYYLRLNLPGKVLYCENPNVDYDIDKKIVTIQAPKAQPGEAFRGLDLITSLLVAKKGKVTASPMIEVIDGVDVIEDADEEFDWSIEQKLPEDKFDCLNLVGQQCGFANSYTFKVFSLKEETSEIFDLKEPQNKPPKLWKEERLKVESEYFDEDHYIADLYHDEEIQQLLKYQPEWEDLYNKLQLNSSTSSDELIHFTSKEKERLRALPNKEYLLEKSHVKILLLGLIDIIFAYAYNKRTTEGENTVESAWTINKLSATLSWLETFSSVPEVAVTCIRRSLCYPLYRHFELSLTVLEDVRKIFLLGRKYVIKCLLEIHELFCLSDPRYILNDLYITDYCVWMQSRRCSSQKLVPLANAVGKVLLTKGDIGFNLVDVESFAKIAWMTHNSSINSISNPGCKEENKITEGNEVRKTKHNSSENNTSSICFELEKLSLQNKETDAGASSNSTNINSNSVVNSDLYSEYESCSSCTSDSSDSSSNTFETDSTEESNTEDTASSSDSDTDSSTESDSDAHSHLLRKENGERLR